MSDSPNPPENMPAAESPTPPAVPPPEKMPAPVPDAPLEPPDFAQAGPPPELAPAAPAPDAVPAAYQESPAEEAQRHISLLPTRASKPHAPAGEDQAAQPGSCPRCGATDFGQGTLVGYDGQTKYRPAQFKPAGLSFFRLHNALRPRRKLAQVEAQVCRRCGLVMFQVNVDKLAKVEGRGGEP